MTPDVIVLLLLGLVALIVVARAIAGSRKQLEGKPQDKQIPPAKPRKQLGAKPEPETAEQEEAAEEDEVPAKPRKDRAALRAGLEKTRGGFVAKLSALFKG